MSFNKLPINTGIPSPGPAPAEKSIPIGRMLNNPNRILYSEEYRRSRLMFFGGAAPHVPGDKAGQKVRTIFRIP